MGVTTVDYEELSNENFQENLGEVYNFGVYKYGLNNKSIKYILQLDFQENLLCLLHRGLKQKSYEMSSIQNIDTVDDSTRILIQFKNGFELEVDPGSLEEKNRISRLLLSIISQAQQGVSHSSSFLMKRSNVLLEGVLEKKGHSAAFLLWTKRFVRILPGEIMYFKVGDEDNDSSALSIIPLISANVVLRKQDDCGFSLFSKDKEYSFRICPPKQLDTERERDNWLIAIQEALKPPADQVDNTTKSASEQELYLKNTVHSLNLELEQLGAILNIIDAPIRASEQVKKVRNIVHSLNEQIKTGLLSWTLRNATTNVALLNSSQASVSNALKNSNLQSMKNESLHKNLISSSTGVNTLKDNFNNQRQENILENISDTDYMRILLPDPPKDDKTVVQNLSSELSSDEMPPKDNLNTLDIIEYTPAKPMILFPNYAKVNKKSDDKFQPYCNFNTKSFDDSIPLPLPPKFLADPSTSVESSNNNQHHKSTNESISALVLEKNSPCNQMHTINEVIVGDIQQVGVPAKPINLKPESEVPSVLNSNVNYKEFNKERLKSISGNVPAPPPIFGKKESLLPLKPDIIPNCKMKPLFWSKLPEIQIVSSFWRDSLDRINDINVKKFEAAFEHNDKIDKKKDETDLMKSQNISLLDQRKAQNLGIFLSGFKLNEVDIEKKLSVIEGIGSFTSDEIIGLRRFQPSADEIEMYKLFKGDISKTTDVDKFMIKLCNIPKLGIRLDVLLTVRELPCEIEAMQTSIQNFMNACLCLNENKNFVRFLEYVLAYGNYMNGGTTRGSAYGFKLDTLNKLIEVRSLDKKYTLLDHIVEELWLIDRDAITCYKDMSVLSNPVDFTLKNLIAEVQLMHKELHSLNTKLNEIKEELGETLSQFIATFVEDYVKIVENLEVTCQSIIELSSLLKKKFGESSATNFEAWLSGIGSFFKHLQFAVESYEQKLDRLMHNKSQNENIVQQHVVSICTKLGPQREDNQLDNKHHVSVLNERNESTNQPNYKNMTVYTVDLKDNLQNEFSEINEGDFLPTKSGFLFKLSGGKKRAPKWDRRFFELTANGYLRYYKKINGKLSGSLYIKGCPVAIDPIDNSFLKILHENREWKLRGDNDLELLDWLNSLSYFAKRD